MAQTPDQRFRRIGILACIIVSGLLVAHSINAFVADALYVVPTAQAGSDDHGLIRPAAYSAAQYMEDIRNSGLFALPAISQSSTREDPGASVARASIGAATKIRLIGVVMGDQRGVFAIAEELASKRQVLYRLHDQILDLGEVADIRRNGIAVRRGNLEEWLELEAAEKQVVAGNPAAATATSSPSAPPGPGTPIRKVIDRREVESAMNDLPKLLTQARAVPHMTNGTLNGFRIDYMAPASFYEKIGVQTGDVLQRVNGVDIRDPGTILSLLQQLKNEQVVKLDIVRNDQRSTITYELR
ncbi:MAG: PDZ domain-containing protein [Nitrospira sp.]|nr:PDZ domain-containing protein [Nitrospira sp.]